MTARQWKAALYSLQPDLLRAEAAPPTWPELPAHRLDRVLALAVERHVMDHGGTVIHEGPHGPVLGYPKTVNHLLYAVLTVLTFGIGAFFWLLAVLERREERIQLQVDRWGHVWGPARRERLTLSPSRLPSRATSRPPGGSSCAGSRGRGRGRRRSAG